MKRDTLHPRSKRETTIRFQIKGGGPLVISKISPTSIPYLDPLAYYFYESLKFDTQNSRIFQVLVLLLYQFLLTKQQK